MSTSARISVVICAHNPRREYLIRTLASLRGQTLPHSHWELLLVDNASTEPLTSGFDLSWHPGGRHASEPRAGLINARLLGLAESRGELIVFVDDDNVLAPDYLAVARELSASKPWLGVWGGHIEPEFEAPPPPWFSPYLPLFAINEVRFEQWSNYTTPNATPPCGAGMCVRRHVAEAWRDRLCADPLRATLGRAGTSLASCEDIDLAFTACELGLGAGRFPALRLVHIIPKERLELSYLLRLIESVAASQVVLRSRREAISPPPSDSWFDRLRERWRDWHRDSVHRQICAAERRGLARGYAQLSERRSPS